MAYQLPAVSVLMFGAAVLMVTAAAAVGWRNREVPGAFAFVVFICCAALWAVTYGVQLLFTDLESQLFWTHLQYPWGLFTCITFGVFVMHYTGRDHRLTRARLAVASVLPTLTSVVVWLPEYRWLVWQEASLVTVSGFRLADITHGPLFDIAVGYSYLVVVGSLGLLGLTTLRTRALYQKQTALITVTAFVPLVGGAVAYVLDITVIDYTPVGLAVFGVGVAIALTRYQLLDVYPVPRNRIIGQIDTGIVVTDADDRIVDINSAATTVVGNDKVIGSELRDIGEVAAEMASMEPGTTTELRIGDSTAYFECTKSTLAAEGGFGDTQLYILTEVTERRERQEALEAKNDRLDSFAAVLSHDLRNPLSVATGSTELARADPAPEHFDRLDQAHERMDEIIDNMLTLARSGQAVSNLEPVDIDSVASDSWQHVETAGAALSIEGTATVTADRKRLKQLFENLFRNAVEHGSRDRSNEEEGSPSPSQRQADDVGAGTDQSQGDRPASPGTTEASQDATDGGVSVRIRVGSTEEGFFVADDGPGIPAAVRDDLFAAGVSETAEGTGVGLAIVKTVVDGHAWDISVSESAAGGARFDIET